MEAKMWRNGKGNGNYNLRFRLGLGVGNEGLETKMETSFPCNSQYDRGWRLKQLSSTDMLGAPSVLAHGHAESIRLNPEP